MMCCTHRRWYIRQLERGAFDARYSTTLLRLAKTIFERLDSLDEVVTRIIKHAGELVDCER